MACRRACANSSVPNALLSSTRQALSKLGVRTVDELVGRSDLLKVRDNLPEQWQKVDLSAILNNPYDARKMSVTFDPKKVYDFKLEKTIDYEKLLQRIRENGMKEETYDYYLDLRKYGSTRHAGFGLGFERAVMYLTGIGNIRDVLPFPRTVGNCEL